ncbi:MAG: F0F1 ATP synthase assembly protein I [Xanthobacteraceae bacterium]|nr:MAG: F0F1 ATP synthase assembly protein I [Xanthobacteraceae bacterium]
MADGTRDNSNGTDKAADRSNHNLPTDEAALSARLSRLDHRLSEIRKERGTQADQSASESQNRSANASAMARGFRLSSELIAGVLVGSAIGWGIDRWLSTSPWGLMAFMLIGFAAGVINVMRAAGVAQGDGSPSSWPNGTTRRDDNARDQ